MWSSHLESIPLCFGPLWTFRTRIRQSKTPDNSPTSHGRCLDSQSLPDILSPPPYLLGEPQEQHPPCNCVVFTRLSLVRLFDLWYFTSIRDLWCVGYRLKRLNEKFRFSNYGTKRGVIKTDMVGSLLYAVKDFVMLTEDLKEGLVTMDKRFKTTTVTEIE